VSYFGDNLHRLVGMHGLTSSEAAKLLEVTPQTFSAWITGKRDPNTSGLVSIRELFEVDALTMIDSRPEEFIPSMTMGGNLARYERVEARINAARNARSDMAASVLGLRAAGKAVAERERGQK
jgi:transcriptional regulator with XRE-family HTH domain